MGNVEALLDAGALLPTKAKVTQDSAVDDISARTYRHRGLGDRSVVRLTADNLAEGDDLVMGFLGFDKPEVQGPIAKKRRQALGFPGWALINDPKHARYALEVVKQFRKEAKRARSKPGHAYDAFMEISKKLGRSVAHFLPSYWEEVGREYIKFGNTHYGSRAFGKAREAEKIHALKIDENLRQEAFLEFALAGCLTNKALNEYGRDLQLTHDPVDAWTFFRELCVRRTLGGMPPWTSMVKDLSGLIEAAGLDVDAELDLLLMEILEAPSMNRAPMGFWKTVSARLKTLAAKSDKVAGLLLNILPDTRRWNRSDVWTWLEYLAEWEILSNVWEDVSDEVGPKGGPAAWVSKICRLDDEPPQRVHDLVRSAAKRLKKDKTPIDLSVEQWGRNNINVDLLDLALELKIPVQKPELAQFNLNDWAEPDEDAVDRPRDPVYIAKSKVFAPILKEAVNEYVGNITFEAAAIGKSALLEARREWLHDLVNSVAEGGIFNAVQTLLNIENQTTRETFAEFPEAYKELKKIDIVPVLARTIRGGIFDEYGWAALEEVVEKMNPSGDEELKFFGSAPHVIVTDGIKAVVVGKNDVVLEHEIKVKKGLNVKDIQYLDGELFVVQAKRWSRAESYWSSAPKKTIKDYHSGDWVEGFAYHLADGGTFGGQNIIRAGDKEVNRDRFYSDGEFYWREVWDDRSDSRVIREVDAETGKTGRKSLPKFFEDYVKSKKKVDMEHSNLVHFGPDAEGSPLGSKDGMVGWRARRNINEDEKDRRYSYRVSEFAGVECEGIDGRKWKGTVDDRMPVGLMDLPGSDQHMVVLGEYGWSWDADSQTGLWDSSGAFQIAAVDGTLNRYTSGQVVGLPPIFWHVYEARDTKASKKLRTISNAQAKKLLQAMANDREEAEDVDDDDPLPALPQSSAVIKKWLPNLKNKRFEAGLLGLVYLASEAAENLEELLETRDPNSEDVVADLQQEACVEEAMECLDVSTGYGDSPPLFPHLATVKAFFLGEREAGNIPAGPFNWASLLGPIQTQVYESYWKNESLNENLAEFLGHWAELALFDLPGKFRTYEGEFNGKPPFAIKKKKKRQDDPPWVLHEFKGNKYVIWQDRYWREDFSVIEYSPNGKFAYLPNFEDAYEVEEFSGTAWSADDIRSYVTAMQEYELPWPDVEQLKSAAEQMNVSIGEVGLLWFGLPNFSRYETNFMPKHLREFLKLKVKEATNARKAIERLKDDVRTRIQDALTAGPPEDLWEDGGRRAIERLVDTWGGNAPKRLDIPADLMKTLEESAGRWNTVSDQVAALADPKKSPLLKSTVKWQFGCRQDEDNRGRIEAWSNSDTTFDGEMLKVASLAVPLLYSQLPGGSDAAKKMADVHDQVVKCLAKPGLIFELNSQYFWGREIEKNKNHPHEVLQQLVGKTKKSKGTSSADAGLLVGYADENSVHTAYRPARLKTERDYEKVLNLFDVMQDDEHYNPGTNVHAVRLMRTPGLKAIAERLRKGLVPEGKYDSDPLVSAPKLVAEVVKKRKLEEGAARLYLQLLALHNPTAANIKLWNEWTTGTLNKAAKELLEKKLILQAKRPRAGRTYFIPGGWEPLKIPHLPLETWKLPLYGITRDEALDKLKIPLPRIVPLQPIPDIFTAAWKRVTSGDEPKYEEVK